MKVALNRLLAVPLLLIGACASPQSNVAAIAPGILAGMPRDMLLSCAGVPHRTHTEGPREFYTYTAGEITAYPAASFGISSYRNNLGFGIGVPLNDADVVRSNYCEATFVIDNGVVTQLNYTSSTGTGAARYRECGRIVQNCVAVANPPAYQRAVTGG